MAEAVCLSFCPKTFPDFVIASPSTERQQILGAFNAAIAANLMKLHVSERSELAWRKDANINRPRQEVDYIKIFCNFAP